MPNPYAILAALGITLSLMIGEFFYVSHIKNVEWEASLSKAKDAAYEQKHAVEAKYDALKDKTEKDYTDARNEIDAAYARGISSGRLRDKGGSCKPVPASPSTASDPPDNAPGCDLSDEATKFLRDFARDADLAAAYAQAGHQLAVGLAKDP